MSNLRPTSASDIHLFMFSIAVLSMLFLANPPQRITFDAEKPGSVTAFIEETPTSGSWLVTAENGVNRFLANQASPEPRQSTECFFKDSTLQDLDFSVKVRFGTTLPTSTSATDSAANPIADQSGFVFRAAGERLCRVSFSTSDKLIKLICVDGKVERTLVSAPLPDSLKAGSSNWVPIDVSVSAKSMTCFVDGKQVLTCDEVPFITYGKIGLFSNNILPFHIDDVSLADIAPALTQILQIRGMTCILCEAKIENALKAIKGVKDAKANHVDGSCLITLDEASPAEITVLIKAVEALNYQVHIEGA